MPFRDAHEITGRIVLDCLERGVAPTDLTLAELRKFSPRFRDDIVGLLTPAQAVARRRATGGTAGSNLRRRLKRLAAK